jgi:glycosyltransferase involved in cell wall biosynthesis
MKIFGLCLVRDEAGMIEHTLAAAVRWADAIYVCDNGSTDGTWEFLQEYAAREPKVVLTGQDLGLYRYSIWGDLANRFACGAKAGDWWCRLDADEIYVDDPREFLMAVRPRHQVVYSASVQYYFTDVDLTGYERDPSRYTERWTPELLRYFLINWSEPRFVRHVPGEPWVDAWPARFPRMRAAPRRIRLRHYQYRSPPQMERRLRTRFTNTVDASFRHEKAERWLPKYGLKREDLAFPDAEPVDGELWRTRVVRAAALQEDGKSEMRIDETLLPPLGHLSRLDRHVDRLLRGMKRRRARR